jgi:hypothetical protein
VSSKLLLSALDSFSVSLLKEADATSLAKLALDGFKASEPGAEFIEKAKNKEELRDNPEKAEELMISLLKSPEFLTKIEEEGPDSAATYLVSLLDKEREEDSKDGGGGEQESTFESFRRQEKIRIIENKAAAMAAKIKKERANSSSGENAKQNIPNLVSEKKVDFLASFGQFQIMTEDQLRLTVRKIIQNNS